MIMWHEGRRGPRLSRHLGGSSTRRLPTRGFSDARQTPSRVSSLGCYSLVLTVLKVLLRLVPTVVMIVTAATAISAAIRPYSIAVTPDWSATSLVKNARIGFSCRFDPVQDAAKNLTED